MISACETEWYLLRCFQGEICHLLKFSIPHVSDKVGNIRNQEGIILLIRQDRFDAGEGK